MSYSVSLELARTQASSSKANWITPKESLKQLRSPLIKKIDEISKLIPDVAALVAQYDQRHTEWYTALKLIGRLPKKIPPLPPNIHKILNKPCPKEICNTKKPDGTFYTVGEKCTLMLVPEELGTLNEFEKAVKAYGKTKYPEDQNPLQFQYFWNAALQEHGNVRFKPTHWVLHTDDVLEKSQNKSYKKQEGLVQSLAKRTSVKWKVPNFHDTITTIFLKKLATGKSLYLKYNKEIKYTFTHVQETTENFHLIVGRFAPDGLVVCDVNVFGSDYVGIAAALQEF